VTVTVAVTVESLGHPPAIAFANAQSARWTLASGCRIAGAGGDAVEKPGRTKGGALVRPDRAIASYRRHFAAPACDASSCGAAGTMHPNYASVCTLPNIVFCIGATAIWNARRAPAGLADPSSGPKSDEVAGGTASIPHHGDALAQLGKPRQLGFTFHQMNRRLALAAVADARIVAQWFQRFPALRALTIQMAALNGDRHGAGPRYFGSNGCVHFGGPPGAYALDVVAGPA